MAATYLNDPLYASHYCEENVYQLAKSFLAHADLSCESGFVVFVSNSSKSTPIWCQKLSEDDSPVVWDYHVIFVVKNIDKRTGSIVVDLDTKLGYPVDFGAYVIKSFQPQRALLPEYQQLFRVIPADVFVAHFASDRSHMIDHKETARQTLDNASSHARIVYRKPAPPWEAIRGAQAASAMNLSDYENMSAAQPASSPAHLGTVLNVRQFLAFGKE